MDQVTNTRNEFILGISLSELAFLYFMLLLLIALFMVKDHINELNKKEETIKDQKELLIAMKREDFDPKTWLIDIKKLKEGNYVLKQQIEKLKKSAITNEELEKFSKITSELDLDGLDDKQFEEKIREFREAKGKVDTLKKENKKLKEQATGWDKPPCFYFIDESNSVKERPKYIYDIEIHDKYYLITPIWMKTLSQEEQKIYARRIVGAPNTKNTLVYNFELFKKFGKKHLSDGKAHECRHHVSIWDKTKNDKNIWQKNLKNLENYFYKKCKSGC